MEFQILYACATVQLLGLDGNVGFQGRKMGWTIVGIDEQKVTTMNAAGETRELFISGEHPETRAIKLRRYCTYKGKACLIA